MPRRSLALTPLLGLSLALACSQLPSSSAPSSQVTETRAVADPVNQPPPPVESPPAERSVAAVANRTCEAKVHDIAPPAGWFGRYDLRLPVEIRADMLEPFGPHYVSAKPHESFAVDCEREGQRAALHSIRIATVPYGSRGRPAHPEQMALAVLTPRSYAPKGCDRERGQCYRREASVHPVAPAVTEDLGPVSHTTALFDIGGGPDEERTITRLAALVLTSDTEVFVVAIEVPRDQWAAWEPSVRAAWRSARERPR